MEVKDKGEARRKLREFEKKSRVLRGDIRKKNDLKVKHLARKFGRSSPNINFAVPTMTAIIGQIVIYARAQSKCDTR